MAGVWCELLASWHRVRQQGKASGVWLAQISSTFDGDFEVVLESEAEAGCPDAQYLLAEYYLSGHGDGCFEEPVFWLRAAAEQGLADAQHRLGECYRFGDGVPLDFKEAAAWFEMAALEEHPQALHDLAWCYLTGLGTNQDPQRAFQLWHQAANLGHSGSLYYISWCYQNGVGATKCDAEAIRVYKKAASLGDIDAQLRLTNDYGEAFEKGRPKTHTGSDQSTKNGSAPPAGIPVPDARGAPLHSRLTHIETELKRLNTIRRKLDLHSQERRDIETQLRELANQWREAHSNTPDSNWSSVDP